MVRRNDSSLKDCLGRGSQIFNFRCVQPGAWRQCVACAAIVIRCTCREGTTNAMRLCDSCGRHRCKHSFSASEVTCDACLWKRSFERHVCDTCGNVSNETTQSGEIGADKYICATCAPERFLVECTCCGKRKSMLNFPRRRSLRNLQSRSIR